MIKHYKVVYKGLEVIEKIQVVGRNSDECENHLFEYVDDIYFDKKLNESDKEQIELYEVL